MAITTFEPITRKTSSFYTADNVTVGTDGTTVLTGVAAPFYVGQSVPAFVPANVVHIEAYTDATDNDVMDSIYPLVWLGTDAFPTTLLAGTIYARYNGTSAINLKATASTPNIDFRIRTEV